MEGMPIPVPVQAGSLFQFGSNRSGVPDTRPVGPWFPVPPHQEFSLSAHRLRALGNPEHHPVCVPLRTKLPAGSTCLGMGIGSVPCCDALPF